MLVLGFIDTGRWGWWIFWVISAKRRFGKTVTCKMLDSSILLTSSPAASRSPRNQNLPEVLLWFSMIQHGGCVKPAFVRCVRAVLCSAAAAELGSCSGSKVYLDLEPYRPRVACQVAQV